MPILQSYEQQQQQQVKVFKKCFMVRAGQAYHNDSVAAHLDSVNVHGFIYGEDPDFINHK